MRFSKMVGRTVFKYKNRIYIYIYITGWLVFMQKRQNEIGFPLIRKEGRLYTFDRVVFLVEMGSRNAV